jgi:PAS domain S-box-containing protein
MTPGKESSDPPWEHLRKEAEKKCNQTPDHFPDPIGKTLEEINHELRVHQIELEIQNEELKKAQEDLEESRDRFINFYDFTPVGHFSLTSEALIREVNLTGAAILGAVRRDLIQDRLRRFVSPKDHGKWDHFFLAVLDHGEKKIEELSLTRKDGLEFSARIEGIHVENYDGSFQICIVVSDLTEQKLAEERIKTSETRYRRLFETAQDPIKLRMLTSLTRHDILNQVSAVQFLLDLALNTLDPAKIHEYLSWAQEAGSQIEATIGFTREYENFGIIPCGWQGIHRMIASAKAEIILDKNILQNQIPEDLEVYADPIIRKIFTTLMENAIRHGERITTIQFSRYEAGGSLILTFVNDGVGIPSEEKERIFDDRFGKNNGIGLFLAREILSITGISIRECGVPGEGARFEILVPEGKWR